MNSEKSLWDYIRVIKRRFRIIFAITILGLIISWVYVSNITPRYLARAQISIYKNILREGAGLQRGVITAFEKASLTRMASNKEVAQLAAQYLMGDIEKKYNVSYSNVKDVQLVEMIRSSVQIANIERSNLLEITATGSKPEEITDYVNAYSKAVLEVFDAERRRNVNELKEYLNAQIAKYSERLMILDERINALKEPDKNLPKGSTATSESLLLVERELHNLEMMENNIKSTKSSLETAVKKSDLDGILSILPENLLTAEKLEAVKLNVELQNLLKQYTESHPKVEQARSNLNNHRAALLKSALTEADKVLRNADNKIDEIQIEKSRLFTERTMISSAISSLPDRVREQNTLQREQTVVSSVIQMFRNRLEDLDLSLTAPADRMEISEYASVPQYPIYPNKELIVGMGLSMSLLIALSFAFILESLDTSLFEIRDVERLIGKPILAVIPSIQIPSSKLEEIKLPIKRELIEKLPLLVDPRSPASEAFRTLRTVIKNTFINAGKKTLLVTSTTPQEGKTTTIVNLAIACADAGMKTVLVGANLRHPIVGRFFPIDRTRGLHEIVTGALSLEKCIQSTGRENLSIIDSGSFARRPAELLSKPEFDATLAKLKEMFDIVLIDSPPTLPVADSATIAPKVDGVLLVYLVSVAPRDALLRCKTILEEVGGNIIGLVFNDIWGASQADYAGYYYYHRYASDEFRRI